MNRFLKTIEELSVQDHLCLIYKTRAEQFDAIVPFIRIGLERNEKCVYVADDNTYNEVISAMRDGGIDVDSAISRGALAVISKKEAYLQHGYFDPDEMINFLKEATDSAKKEGFSALRVAGEMTWVLGGDPGSERLIEYEAKLNYFFPENDCLAICQYNYNRFSPEITTNIIYMHPIVISGNMVCKNFYYIPPDEFFKTDKGTFEPDKLLDNIRNREQAEEELLAAKDEFERFFVNISSLACIASTDGYFKRLNPEWEKTLGYKVEELYGEPLVSFIHPDDVEPTLKEIEKQIGGGRTANFTNRYRCKDGTYRWLEWRASPAKDGKLLYATALDITERKKAEEALKESESKYKTLFNSASDAIFIIDTEGAFQEVNDVACERLGYTREELLKMTPAGIGDEEYRGKAFERIKTVKKTGHVFFEGIHITKDKREIPVEINSKIIEYQGNPATLSIARDITERMKAEEELQRIEWMLKPEKFDKESFEPAYGDVVKLNTDRTILNAVGNETLEDIVSFFLNLLGTSAAVYEKNGDYAFGIFSSGWCQFLDYASFENCKTKDLNEALNSGKWHCHESCWTEASKKAIESGHPVEIECNGGIHLYTAPIRIGDEIIGSINFGYGDPPRDDKALSELASKYKVDINDLRRLSNEYKSRPQFIIDLAKNRLEGAASTIALMVYRKQAEEKLKQNEEKFRGIFEQSPIAIELYDQSGHLIDANKACLDLFGIDDIKEVEGFNLFEDPNLPVDTKERLLNLETVIFESIFDFEVIKKEHLYRTKRSGQCYIDLHIFPTLNEDKIPGGFLVHVQEITERKKAEEELKESATNLIEAQRIAHIGSWSWDIEGDKVRWSKELYEISGRNPNLAPPTYAEQSSLYSTESWECLSNAVERAAKEGVPYDLELEMLHTDGHIIHTSTLGRAIKDESGTVVNLYGTVQDITERKKAEEELKLHESRLQSMLKLNKMVEASEKEIMDFVVDEIIKITKSSFAFVDYVNEDEAECISRSYSKDVMKECSMIDQPIKFSFKKAGIWIEAIRKRKPVIINDYANTELPKKGFPDGHVPLTRLISVPIFDDDKIVSIACVANKEADYQESDVNALVSMLNDMWRLILRKRAEEEKKDLWNQLLQSQKLESVGRLTGGIAHDFNNILTGILGYSELALRNLDKDNPLNRKLNIILDSTQKAANLVKQLLAFSRKQVLEMRTNNLNTIVESMSKMLTRVIGEDVRLTLDIKKAVSNVTVDETQMEQVLMNLVVNARDAMPGGGALTIKTEEVCFDEDYCRMHTEVKPGSYVMLSVEDTGVGISKEVQDKIFEPFFTTKEKGKGSGLGLSTVFGIVKQHNGSISLYSEPGKGTVFKVYIPVAKDDMKAVMKDESDELSGGNETVLIVDDDDIIRGMTKELLEGLGYKTLVAESGEDALQKSNELEGTIDLMLTDVVMTGMNGWDAAKEIQKKRPDMKVIFSSGYMENPVVLHNIVKNKIPFINKPYKSQALTIKIREVLDEKVKYSISA